MASFRSTLSDDLPDIPISIAHYLKCPICLDKMVVPVTTSCGHTFCKACIDCHMSYNDRICPLCKEYLQTKPSVNVTFKSLLEDYSKEQQKELESERKFTAGAGEVSCDVCPDQRKRKADKSCLMCLLSYCSHHLKPHQKEQRLKGHQLVDPVEKLDERACLTHGRPLELYSTQHQQCICSLCVEEGTEVLSVETERGRKEEKLDSVIKELEQRIQQREEKEKELVCSAGNCLALIEREQKEIKEVFDGVRRAVQRAEEEALSPLEDKRRSVEEEVKELREELQKEITMSTNTISKLHTLMEEDDPILFLQSYPSIPASDTGKDWTTVAVNTEMTFGTLRNLQTTMMADIETELEKLSSIEIERIQKFEVDVTLDPDSANAQLLLSDDGKEVLDSGTRKDVQDRPERFDLFGSVLGLNCLSDSRAFWMVDVGDKQGWDIGIAKKEANRKGKLSIKPSQGYWVIVCYNGDQYAALEDSPTLLSLPDKPRKVGVFMDYEEKLVSFYDVEAKTHIYSFTDCRFNEGLRPYFSPHFKQEDKNSSPLVICSSSGSKKQQLIT